MNKYERFITVEGIEGVGKTTNVHFLRDWLEARGLDVVVTREPGGTALAEEIRSLLLEKRHETVAGTTELLLMFAARAQHLEQVIIPALDEGKWVLCDRFTDATYAYQGSGRGISIDLIRELESLVQGPVRPGLTFLLDAPVELGLSRAAQRSEKDRIESETLMFFERVREGYLQLAQQHPRIKVINTAVSLPEVQQQIAQQLELIWQ